jgi:ABC transport system ATP-binding/permease protein
VLKLIIEDDEGRKTVVPFVRDEITIGRQEGNTIRLTERNVSRRHARLVRQNGHVVVEDLGSYTGVLLNGERIEGPAQLRDGDLIQIGDYDLALQSESAAATQPAVPTVRGPSEDEEPSDSEDAEAEQATPSQADKRRQSTAVIRADQVDKGRNRRVEEVDPEDAPRLLVVSDEFNGQEFACILTEMRLGRTEDNDIALDHRSLSRTHAKFVREDSGEWRIIDMQSANGLTVNGESYAQAALSHGDLIELGHVKLRFIGPGQSSQGLTHARTAKGTKKKLLLVGMALALLVVGGGLAWALLGQSAKPVPPPRVVETPSEPKPPPPQEQPATPPEVPAIAQLAEKLQSARQAMAANDFDLAVDTLTSLQNASGQRPPEVEQLLDQARAEQQARQSLKLAQKEFQAGRPQEAMKHLEASAGTFAFEAEHAALKQKVEEALAPPGRPSPRPGRRSLTEELKRHYDDGVALMRQKQYAEAESILKKCLALDPTYAPCHLVMGTTLARRQRFDEGARHYREFLRLAPNDEMAPGVRANLETYEKSKEKSGTR